MRYLGDADEAHGQDLQSTKEDGTETTIVGTVYGLGMGTHGIGRVPLYVMARHHHHQALHQAWSKGDVEWSNTSLADSVPGALKTN